MNRPLSLLISALAWAAPSVAQQVYLRVPGTNYCDVAAASNATPIRITFSGSCGLTNGATIVVVDVRGNLAANVHLDSSTDTANVARKVANLTSASFDLMDLNNQP